MTIDILEELEDAVEIFNTVLDMENMAEEVLVLMTLDAKNKVTGLFQVSHGSLNSSIIHPSEIYKRALLQNASAIVIGHNHPSATLTPSQKNLNTTRHLHEAGKLLGIDLIDHIIIGDGRLISLKEKIII